MLKDEKSDSRGNFIKVERPLGNLKQDMVTYLKELPLFDYIVSTTVSGEDFPKESFYAMSASYMLGSNY
jgi:hypothetical protein